MGYPRLLIIQTYICGSKLFVLFGIQPLGYFGVWNGRWSVKLFLPTILSVQMFVDFQGRNTRRKYNYSYYDLVGHTEQLQQFWRSSLLSLNYPQSLDLVRAECSNFIPVLFRIGSLLNQLILVRVEHPRTIYNRQKREEREPARSYLGCETGGGEAIATASVCPTKASIW